MKKRYAPVQASPMVCLSPRWSAHRAASVFLSTEVICNEKTLIQKRTGGLGEALGVAPCLVLPNRPSSVWLKKNTALYILETLFFPTF